MDWYPHLESDVTRLTHSPGWVRHELETPRWSVLTHSLLDLLGSLFLLSPVKSLRESSIIGQGERLAQSLTCWDKVHLQSCLWDLSNLGEQSRHQNTPELGSLLYFVLPANVNKGYIFWKCFKEQLTKS